MGLKRAVNRFLREENGSFMSTAVFLAIIAVIVAIAVIDGGRCLNANRAAANAAQGAAEAAFKDYETYSNVPHAENAAADYCESHGADFIDIRPNTFEASTFDVTCGKDADTYVFKRLPILDQLVHQEETKTSTGTS